MDDEPYQMNEVIAEKLTPEKLNEYNAKRKKLKGDITRIPDAELKINDVAKNFKINNFSSLKELAKDIGTENWDQLQDLILFAKGKENSKIKIKRMYSEYPFKGSKFRRDRLPAITDEIENNVLSIPGLEELARQIREQQANQNQNNNENQNQEIDQNQNQEIDQNQNQEIDQNQNQEIDQNQNQEIDQNQNQEIEQSEHSGVVQSQIGRFPYQRFDPQFANFYFQKCFAELLHLRECQQQIPNYTESLISHYNNLVSQLLPNLQFFRASLENSLIFTVPKAFKFLAESTCQFLIYYSNYIHFLRPILYKIQASANSYYNTAYSLVINNFSAKLINTLQDMLGSIDWKYQKLSRLVYGINNMMITNQNFGVVIPEIQRQALKLEEITNAVYYQLEFFKTFSTGILAIIQYFDMEVRNSYNNMESNSQVGVTISPQRTLHSAWTPQRGIHQWNANK
ncbi:hypothetical protein TVAGG3_0401100 [Trichomonas vaginalis G3]|uniref:hypothetical protein n=1 Tax=Trichomonas vaginalis (strain ATCC PRA-98 / G3) TaxID=412133 RepID=UPI0021E5B1A3|nr:hypothetical protein TVAGG3_0401100 [Trichomonas vaginalis G3]KAI5534699.1 hypothetical protein TVAGG3_0401100 [Trichomonas vaginalis G3]